MNAKTESTTRPAHTRRHGDDLRGVGRLAIDAVHGVTDVVEAMHRNISGRALPVGKPLSGPTTGIAGLVYKSVRGVTRLVGEGVDAALAAATPLLGQSQPAPLHAAVVIGSAEAAKLLLAGGANINGRDPAERTALHLAAATNQKALVELLLAGKANATLRDKSGKTAEALARENGHSATADAIKAQEKPKVSRAK